MAAMGVILLQGHRGYDRIHNTYVRVLNTGYRVRNDSGRGASFLCRPFEDVLDDQQSNF